MIKFIRNLFNNYKQQCNIPVVVCSTWAVAYETYSAGSEGAGMLKDGFKSKREALKYLKNTKGKMEAFTHGWNANKGDWYMPKGQGRYGHRSYYCICECA